MKNRNSVFVVALCAIGAIAVTPTTARAARLVSFSSGRAVPVTDESCFSAWYTSLKNTCSTTKKIDVPLPVDNIGQNKTVAVSGVITTFDNNIFCQSFGLDEDLTTVYSSARVSMPNANDVPGEMKMTTYTPGILYVSCSVSPGTRVQTVYYNQ